MKKLTESQKLRIPVVARKALDAKSPDDRRVVVEALVDIFMEVMLVDSDLRAELEKIAAGDQQAIEDFLK